jgi:hypothetical protein
MNVDGFPPFTITPGTALYRIHRASREPWWFSSDGSGRFDPVDFPDMGSCYFAEEQLGAWIEVFRTALVIADTDVATRRLFSPVFSRELVLADVTHREALRFGVTASLGAGEDYGPSQTFAAAAAAAGFSGVRYLVRHDPSQRLTGIALFGPDGAAELDDLQWPSQPDLEIPEELVLEAASAFGYRVVPAP